MNSPHRRFLAAVLAVYVAKQVVTVLLFPPFTGHDEVAHYQYIRILATEGRVPTLFSHTLPVDLYRYHAYSIAWTDREGSALYTAVHPPLYYALMVPIYRAAHGMTAEEIQYLLRFAAIPVGALVVVLASLLTRAVFPRDGFLAVTVPSVVAFQPQVSYVAAMVNNDILLVALYSLLLYLLVLTVRDGLSTGRVALVGLVAGLAVLAKASAIMSFALIPAAFWMARGGGRWTSVAWALAVAALPIALLAGPWWWFLIRTYGDPMAFAALAATQPHLVRDEPFLNLLFSGSWLVERWEETWGEFSWKLIHISGGLTALLGAAALAGLIGLGTYGARSDAAQGELEPWQRRALVLLAAACLLNYIGIVHFGTRFVLTQARYYFPVVNAAAVLAMLGLRAWIPGPWRVPAQGMIVLAAIGVNVIIYTAYVVPYWYFRS